MWSIRLRRPAGVGHAAGFVTRMLPVPPVSLRTRALLMLLLANLFWGLSFPVIKALILLMPGLVPAAGGGFITAYTLAPRFLLATLVLVARQVRPGWQVSRGELQQGVVLGLFAGVGMVLQNDGLRYTAASTSAFLTQFYAILIPVWVAWRVRRAPGPVVWVSCLLVLAGVAILGHFDWHELRFGRGEWETLLSSLFFMAQILWLEKEEFAGNRPAEFTLVMFATEGVMFWVMAAATAPGAGALLLPWASPAWLALTVVLTGFCTLGAFGLMNAWQPKITATEAGLMYCVEPIFGSAMAMFLPAFFSVWAGIQYANEPVTRSLLVGGGLITLANVLVYLKPPKTTPA